MNWNFHHLLPSDFAPYSRVWIYQANRLLSLSEALEAETLIDDFVANWKSHGADVKGFGTLLFGQFIVLMSDETETGVSGCSTDSSVRFIKEMEQQFNLQLFDRLSLAFIVKDKIQLLPLSQLKYAIDNGFIEPDTLYFNNVVLTKNEMEQRWIIPLRESWLANKIIINQP
jgi:hypothetical protein